MILNKLQPELFCKFFNSANSDSDIYKRSKKATPNKKIINEQGILVNLSRNIRGSTALPGQIPPMILQGESVRLRNFHLR